MCDSPPPQLRLSSLNIRRSKGWTAGWDESKLYACMPNRMHSSGPMVLCKNAVSRRMLNPQFCLLFTAWPGSGGLCRPGWNLGHEPQQAMTQDLNWDLTGHNCSQILDFTIFCRASYSEYDEQFPPTAAERKEDDNG